MTSSVYGQNHQSHCLPAASQQAFVNSLMDCRNCAYVFARVFQTAAFVSGATCVALSFAVSPIWAFGIIPALVVGIFAQCIFKKTQPALQNSILPPPLTSQQFVPVQASVIPGQPLALPNFGANCWLNACMQCILNVPALYQKAKEIPAFSRFIDDYQRVQSTLQSYNGTLSVQGICDFLSTQAQFQRFGDSPYGQLDAAKFFEWFFNNHPLYYFVKTWGNRLPRTTSDEPLISLPLWPRTQEGVQQRFNSFFDHMTAERERLRLQFFSLPDVLVVNLKRYYQIGDQEMQITDPVEGIERTLKLNSQAVLTGESADYRCVAFLVHTGSFQSGHYIAYIWKEGRWWCCNDALIYAVSDQEARQQMRNCYLFFATRK